MNNLLQTRRNDAVARGLTNLSDIYIERALNSELWDCEGRRYIDFAAGTSTMNVGHSHPRIVSALHKQIDCFTHTFWQQLPYASYIELCEKLNEIVPGPGPKKTALFTDGAGAVENALKIARHYTNRPNIIAFGGAFHGRTLLGSTLAGKPLPYRDRLGPAAPGIYHVPFAQHDSEVDLTIQSIDNLFNYEITPTSVAAIIFEPVQGEGGIRPIAPGLFEYLRTLCDKHKIVLIADEVQCGLGRTGKMWAQDHYDVTADLTVISKSLGAGIPISAVTGKQEIMDSPGAGGLGGTYNGNPLGCAAALTVLDIIRDEDLLTRSEQLGTRARVRLNSLKDNIKFIKTVRGLGSMTAVELDNLDICRAVQRHAREQGLILITATQVGSALRLLYPLTIQDSVFDEGLDILIKSLEHIWNNQ